MKKPILLLILFLTISLQSQNKIEKIEFWTEGYTSAPDFDLIIYSDRTAIFIATSDNYKIPPKGDIVGYGTDNKGINIRKSEVKGIFLTTLKNKNYKEIVNLVNKLDEEFDKQNFDSNTLHNSVGKLKVTYKSGEIKTIYDNGMNGSKALLKLYDYFMDLRFNQKWK